MPIRDTFWNVPLWAEIAQYLLGLAAALVFVYGVGRRVRVWQRGRPSLRSDRLLERLRGVIIDGLLHGRLLARPYPGVMHLAMFWGFVALFAGTALATLDWDVARLVFGAQFLRGGVYVVYELVLDAFALFLLIGLGMAAWRRYIVRAPQLRHALSARYSSDDAYTLGVMAILVITGYMIEGLRIAVVQPEWAIWSPVGNAIAAAFVRLGDPTNQTLHTGLWLFHALLSFGAIAAIPYTKFFHALASPLNIYFRDLGPMGALEPIDKIEEAETLGAGKIEDWTWKQLLDFDACTRCGRCQDACPAHATGKPLSPQSVIVKLGAYLAETPLATGRPGETRAMHGNVISADELWDCTTCAACLTACPVYIDQLGAIVEMRRYLTMSEGDISRNLNTALTNIEQNGNPYGLARAQRLAWAEGLGVRSMAEHGGKAEWLYWVGCAAAYDDRNKKVARAFVRILQAAGVDFAVLGQEETCTGDSARRAGNEYLFQMLAQENIATLNGYGVKKIVTACPHCFNTLKNEYPLFGGVYQVVHHSQLIADLLAEGRLKLPAPADAASVAYHDPCYLGRHNGVYEPARRVLAAAGAAPLELARHHANSFCCGAGGARNWMEESRGTRINQNRAAESVATGAETLAVSCPFCLGMLSDGLQAKAATGERSVAAVDIAEVVAARLAG